MAAASVGRACAGVSALVYASDVAHVYGVLREREREEETYSENWDDSSPERWYASNESNETDGALVEEADFQRVLAAKTALRTSVDGDMLRAFREALYIQRESSNFVCGGRAALLQLAHPYVAAGVAAHSNLAAGVQERFYRTFKYMFAMIYEDAAGARAAAAQVRRLHQKVHGTLHEAVGAFPAGHRFDANHPHALLWVHLTLLESAMFAFEMVVHRLDEAQKDAFVRAGNTFANAYFGVPDHLLPADHAAFMREFHATLRSGVIGVGGDARRIDGFLWRAPSAVYRPLLASTRWLTWVMLPAKVASGFYGRSAGTFERLVAALYLGLVRFLYRLMPRHFRWLSPYVALRRRQGAPQSNFDRKCAAASAAIANRALAAIMPPRPAQDLEKTPPSPLSLSV